MPEPEIKPEEAKDEAQDKAIEVDLDKPEGQVEKTSSEPKYVTVDDLEKIRKQLNGLSYMGRQFQEISRKIDSLGVQRPAPMKPEAEKDEWDKKVETNWKGTVEELAELKFQEMMSRREALEQQRAAQQQKITILEQSKQKVIERYPEIQDPDSEIAKKYMKILNQNQDYLRNDRGPELAMAALENEFRSEGRLDEISKRAVEKEVNRQVRTAVTTLPRSTNGSSPNKVMLTKEQREFCDNAGMKYENYAKMLKKQEVSGRQGVEV